MNTVTCFSWVLACALWTGIAGPAAANDVRPVTDQVTEQNRRIIAQAFERWADGGNTFFQDILAPDVRWTIQGSGPAAGTYDGLQDFMTRAVRPFADRLSTPVRPTAKTIWADGDHVIVRWDGSATAGDGAPYRNSYVWIFRMANGRAAEVTAFLDLAPYDDVIRRVPLGKKP